MKLYKIISLIFGLGISSMNGAEILNLSQNNFKDVINKSKKPVVIKAYAEWCGHCQDNQPVYNALADELGKKYLFAQFNVDTQKQLAKNYNIQGLPTFLFLKGNKVVGSHVGALPQDKLKASIEQNMKK